MATPTNPDAAKKRPDLITRIANSPAFEDSPKSQGLLRFLYRRRNERLSAKIIEAEHFGKPLDSSKHNEGHARNACDTLRKLLDDFIVSSPGGMQCTLPKVRRGQGGYKLAFSESSVVLPATAVFWQHHLAVVRDVVVVSGTHMFLFDAKTNSVVRYYDFNEERDKIPAKETLKRFKLAHPEAYKANLEPLNRSYLSSGEVYAFEAIQKWFHAEAKVLVPRLTSREIPDDKIHRYSPILIGRPATNGFISSMMSSKQARGLAYRIGESLGAIRITKISEEERKALSDFPLTNEGLLGPVPGFKTVFGLLTRIRNPSGFGVVTIISADFQVRAITKIAEVLTTESLARELLLQTTWPSTEKLPETFEMLFAIDIAPGDLEGEGHARLLTCRP